MTGTKKGRGIIVSAVDFQFSTVIWRVSITCVGKIVINSLVTILVSKLKEDFNFFALFIRLCQVVGHIGKIFGRNYVPHYVQLLENFKFIIMLA